MPKLPTVAIIGRPNTGKSTLFNRFVGRRKAIVSEIAGTTRDHISHKVEEEIPFLIVDTGGIGSTDDKDFEKDVAEQSLLALENADVILFTVNGKEEITGDDRKIIDFLRKKRKRHVPIIVVITKTDSPAKMESAEMDYQEVNIGEEFLTVSAEHRLGMDELKDAILQQLKKLHFERRSDEQLTAQSSQPKAPQIAIIGKPNVGKSSIVNALMSDADREASPVLVSPIAGTTRDSIDTTVTYHGKEYILIDTAGLKKHARTKGEVERYSTIRTLSAVEQADIVILVLSAGEPVTQQDKRIASLAVESGKGLIILLNKIDLKKGNLRKSVVAHASASLQFVSKFAKIIPTSAVSREGLLKLFDIVEAVQLSRTRRIPTRELKLWFEQVVYGQPLGEISKVKYMTQAKDIPPTFVLFVKNPKRVSVSQLRYLENRLRETFGFDGTPIRWITKSTSKDS